MKIFDNLITAEYQNEIENTLMDVNFPWFFFKYTTATDDNSVFVSSDKTTETPQFVHIFYMNENINSHYIHNLIPIITAVEEKIGRNLFDNMIRFKANLVTKHSSYPVGNYHLPHTDSYDCETESILYYANESDGDTYIFNEKPPSKELTLKQKIQPKRGRIVFFNSSYYHASSPPRDHDIRLVLNIVFRK